ncbi:RNA-directed DNA polymerase, eukaryota [Artemisia annua]|uniref:RNA-directed DNA polymerase, eukaryota n=1 Tax=Artemisia annua TaxID=35608 RepID=A0A2U1MY49_ARTAN|nr:RNA-directed DNA polymerase, eukaryota [Artemisia annua]
MSRQVNMFKLKSMWGNFQFDFACSSARGHSGGIVSMWDTGIFVKSSIQCGEHYVVVDGKLLGVNQRCVVINIYAPQELSARSRLWYEIKQIIRSKDGFFIVFGDFNEVREESERCGSVFDPHGVALFNEFINDTELVDLPIGGRKFTWMNKSWSKMSKLDRFLVSESIISEQPEMSVLALDRTWSDHSPILMRKQKVDYGPVPFRIFHSWFEVPGFHEVVLESYNNFSNNQGDACIDLKKKLKHVKGSLKLWHKEFKEAKICTRKKLCEDILLIEKKMDDQMAKVEEVQNRAVWIKELAGLDRIDALDVAQKAKVKWDIEGDENSALFHGLLKQRRRLQMVQGIMHDSEWCTDPKLVKRTFLEFYREKFVAVRRSGRLSNIRRPRRDNEEYETIDLTLDGDSEEEQGKCAAGKRKMKPHVVKGTKKVDIENGDCNDKDAAHEDGNSTDDDFVAPKKTKIPKVIVVYATLDSPIKHCSSELLYKLEGEMFPNQPFDDSAADDRGADEVIHDEDVDEDIGWEDVVFEDPGSESVPVNAEVMKKNLSLYLKRAGELRDMADRLLVKGLEDNPDDHGFMELKEVRDQMFVNHKYYHNPEDNEGLTKETYDKCFTPEKGVNKKDSGAADELSRFGRESMGNKSKDIVPVYPDPVPLNVLVPNLAHARAKRPRLLPEVYRSPYMTREVSVVDGLGKHELKVAECFFSARFSETDIVFKTRYVDGERVVLESLFPGIDIASGAIDLFTHVLNNAEKHRSKMTVTRLFCHTSMLTSDMESWEYERMFGKFVENMDAVVNRSEYKTLDGVQMVFFPVIQGRHFFVVCMNMKDGQVEILDNLLLPDKTEDERFTWFIIHLISVFEDYLLHKKNPYYERMTHATRKVLPKGHGADLCCLSKEGKKQLKELRDLRIKYAVKILLSDCNLVKTDIDKEVNAFRNVPDEEKKRLRMAAFETIKLRVATKFEPSMK